MIQLQGDSQVRRSINRKNRLKAFHLSSGSAIFLGIAILTVMISVVFFVLSMLLPYLGIELEKRGEFWAITVVEPNGLASQAGIQVGDIPIKINSLQAEIFLKEYENASFVAGIVKEITVTDRSGQPKSVSVRGKSPSFHSVVSVATWFIVSTIFWMIGFYVFLKRPNNSAASVFLGSAIVFGLALGANAASYRELPFAIALSVAGSVFGPWALLHFFLILPEERSRLRTKRFTYLIYSVPAVTYLLFMLVGYADALPVLWFRNVRYLEAGIAFLAAAAAAVFNFFGASSPRTRQQMKMITIGCAAALVPFFLFYIIPKVVWGEPIVPDAVSVLFISFIPLSMGYAVATQKLMDIDVIIRRGVVYGLVSILMALVLAAAVFPVLAFRQLIGVPEVILISLILGALATVLFGTVKRGIENLVDRLFYKDRYDYRQIVQNVSAALNLVGSSTEASRLIVGTTVRTLNLAGAAIFTKTQTGSLEIGATQGIFNEANHQVELSGLLSMRNVALEFPNTAAAALPDLAYAVPLTVAEREVGMLFISQKVTRQDFSSDDLFLLQGLASIAAMALHRTILIRDVSMRDIFVSVASHELRTPLTSILGYADLLLRRNPPEDTRRRWVQSILDNTKRVADMADELLNVSRIQSGRVSIKLVKTGLPDILSRALSVAKETTDRHEFVYEVDPTLPPVMIDIDKFGQVVGNLLSNAVKYSPAGGRITLSAHSDEVNHQVVVSVSDQGIGIGPDDQSSLFTTFHRIQRPETQSIKGSGLGLYIAKEWTEAMKGRIWVESDVNKGSTFFIRIPAMGPGEV